MNARPEHGGSPVKRRAGRPDRRLTVLCGHTHSGGTIQPAPNGIVHTAAAEYGRPRVERIIEV